MPSKNRHIYLQRNLIEKSKIANVNVKSAESQCKHFIELLSTDYTVNILYPAQQRHN